MNPQIDELIYRFLSSEPTPEESEQLDRWLAESDEHMRYFLKCKNLYDVYHPVFLPEEIDMQKALTKVAPASTQPARKLRHWSRLAAAVLIPALMLGAGIYFYKPWNKTSQPTDTILSENTWHGPIQSAILTLASGEELRLDKESSGAITDYEMAVALIENNQIIYTSKDSTLQNDLYHTLSVPRGGEFFLTLSDQTKIWVNADSKVRFPVTFAAGQERRIFIEGEAYLEVAHDAEHPFRVVMPHNDVVVLGTAFNVNAYTEEQNSLITLVSGRVRIESDENEQNLILAPGQQAIVNNVDGKIIRQAVDTEIYCSWREGQIIFKNNTLEEILRRLSRWYDLQINWQDESLKNLSFSGEIKKYEQIEKLLLMIEKTNEVSFSLQGQELLVDKP